VLSPSSFSQTIEGVVTDSLGQPISDCYLLFHDVERNTVLDYVLPNKQGQYSLILESDSAISHIKIECRGLSYATAYKTITLGEGRHKVDFILESKDNILDEIVISDGGPYIEIKEDTVVYNVGDYETMEDRSLADVLSKMPGIEVNKKTGQIKYKGIPITTILIEGSDLLGKQYSVGSLNIPSEIVEQVEAIEDYHENRLEKGVNRSNEVVLNLKIKKGESDTSGELVAGLGLGDYALQATLITISGNFKGFGIANANNISVDNTPYRPSTYATENREEVDAYPIYTLENSNVGYRTHNERSYDNRLRYAGYQSTFKIGKKTEAKVGTSAYWDYSTIQTSSENRILTAAEEILQLNRTDNSSQPFRFGSEFRLNHDFSDSSLMKAHTKLSILRDEGLQEILQNGTEGYLLQKNNLLTYFHQDISYSKKMDAKSLFGFETRLAMGSREQELSANRPIEANLLSDSLSVRQQEIDGFRVQVASELHYKKKLKKGSGKIALKMELAEEMHTLDSKKPSKAYTGIYAGVLSTDYSVGSKTKLNATAEGGFAQRQVTETTGGMIAKNSGFLDYTLGFQSKLSIKSLLYGKYARKNQLPNRLYYLANTSIILDSRSIVLSEPDLDFVVEDVANLSYTYNDMIIPATFSISVTLKNRKNTFISRQVVNNQVGITTFYQSPVEVSESGLAVSYSKFIDSINNKLSLYSSASLLNSFGSYNTTEVVESKFSMVSAGISLNSAFKGRFNYKSDVGVAYSKSNISEEQSSSNVFLNSTLTNIFKLSKVSYFKIDTECMIPNDFDLNNAIAFVDFRFNYRTKKGEYFVRGQNLIGTKSYTQVYISENIVSTFSRSTVGRRIILGISYRI
jgi:hypothetical protein